MAGANRVVIDGVSYPIDDATAVDFEEQQTLTDAQKAQARSNISAASQDDMTSVQNAVGNVPSGSNLQDEVADLKSAIDDTGKLLQSTMGENLLSKAYKTTNKYYSITNSSATDSNNWLTYFFHASDIDFLSYIATYSATTLTTIQIAFYSSDTISNETFISGIAFEKASTLNTIEHVIAVPENAVTIIISNRKESGNPIIYGIQARELFSELDGLKDELNKLANENYLFLTQTATNENGSISGDIGNEIVIGSQTYWKHIQIDVTEGESYQFIFNSSSSTNINPYILATNSENIIVAQFAQGIKDINTQKKYIITVPNGATKIYARSFDSPVIVRKGYTADASFTDLRNESAANIFSASLKNKNRMLFSAHRGAEGQAPYGSYPSYELACSQGWDMLQIAQARQSADGTWYCLHDATVDAQTNGTGAIADLSDEYIESIYQDVGVNVSEYTQEQLRIPTLESILQLAYRYGLKISIRMGSLPDSLTEPNRLIWENFIALVKDYSPENMMFSGTRWQVMALKKMTPNWHGNIYAQGEDDVKDIVDYCVAQGWTNISIMADKSKVSKSIISYIHDKGFYYLSSQMSNPEMSQFIELSNWGCDIAQTGLSPIHSLN